MTDDHTRQVGEDGRQVDENAPSPAAPWQHLVAEETEEPPHQGLSRRTARYLLATFLLIALASAMGLVHLPYAIIKPGPATNALGKATDGKPLIAIEGTGTYPTTGSLDFTTVAVYGGPVYPVNAWEVLGGLLDHNSQVVPEEDEFPQGVTGKQVDELNAAQMADSQQEAIAIALRKVGRTVPEVVKITQVLPDAPSGSVLKAGDVIQAVDGQAATTSDAVRDAIQKHKPGDTVSVTVRRNGADQTLAVKTGKTGTNTVLGVLLQVSFDFPVKVTINAGDVGGPSAGMMFSLAIYDKLTPGALTAGAAIAGTGTIDADGNVGPIGGIRQKMIGARGSGAGWFLAPAVNCDEVVGHVPDGLRVVKVATFDQARAAVEAIGAKKGDSLAQCTLTAAAR